jgi:hypothetical protein
LELVLHRHRIWDRNAFHSSGPAPKLGDLLLEIAYAGLGSRQLSQGHLGVRFGAQAGWQLLFKLLAPLTLRLGSVLGGAQRTLVLAQHLTEPLGLAAGIAQLALQPLEPRR